MKKKWEVRYFVTAVASIPVYKAYSKTETYRQAAKDGWGTVYRDENNALVCDEDCSASLYTKNGGYFGIFSYEEINTKEMPKQAACAAIIVSDSCGFTFWAEDFNQIHIFVTYDESGLVDTYRVEYGDSTIYDGETEISFEDLYQQAEEDWRETYRAELPGTIEYQRKQEAAELAAQAAASAGQRETWMDEAQQKDFREICGLIDTIKSGRDFYRVMNQIDGGRYSVDVINAAREFKQCFNSAQYEPEAPSAGTLVAVAAGMVERDAAADVEPQPIALTYMDDLGVARCGECGAELLCNETGDMPDVCPECGRRLEYDFFREPEGPDADAYRTRADNQQGTGTAAEAASEGRETALGTPEAMAGTDATEAAGGQQPPPQAGEINLGKLYAGTRLEATEQDEGKQPGGP